MKKKTYNQESTACVSFFLKKSIYCVTFISQHCWFDNKEEAEKYKGYLFELYFFSYSSFCLKDKIVIKEYQIDRF